MIIGELDGSYLGEEKRGGGGGEGSWKDAGREVGDLTNSASNSVI